MALRKKLITPFQKFLNYEGSSGILLLVATVAALIAANTPLQQYYEAIWDAQIGISTPFFELDKPLILWVNDGLMAVFFFLIGLEIKREILIGELNSLKKISFPLIGALGGMLIPIAMYLLINQNPETAKGWGIPMATDIAFSLAVLKMLGKRIPVSLIVFLTAFAIVDDIGAVIVIALFYSGDIQTNLLLWSSSLLLILYYFSYKGYYNRYISTLFGFIVWLLFLKAGIHPTLAGILMAFSVPISQNLTTQPFLKRLDEITVNIKQASVLDDKILSKEQLQEIEDLEELVDEYQSPLQSVEEKLHGWVAYVIIPIFAFANAGVAFNNSLGLDTMLVINIVVCLVVGKSIGITSLIVLFKKLNLIEMPSDLTMKHILGVSFLAGIGFTMAIFVAGLAFMGDDISINSAKIGILIGSFLSGLIGYFVLASLPKLDEEIE